MNKYSVLAVLLGVLCLILLWLLKVISERNKVLKKERLELVLENERFEYFVTNYFFLKMRNEDDIKSSFLSLIEDYVLDKKFPKSYLHFICQYLHNYGIFKKLLSEDLKRISESIVATGSLESTCDRTEILLNRQKKINKLLTDLIRANSECGGSVLAF